jgi:thiamine biosynthesis lipoprotein
MGTVVTIDLAPGATLDEAAVRDAAVDRALAWCLEVETRCTRFDPRSELMRVCARVGVATPASPMLVEAVRFALAVAEASRGAFDPTVGRVMERRGFNREHRTGAMVDVDGAFVEASASYRDVDVDADRGTIALRRALVLDLGAVAKGLAVDMAARELQPFGDFAIDAGGDLYLGGRNPDGQPWAVGIRHPRRDGDLVDVVRVSDQAVCTSGDYERRSRVDGGSHLLDPRTGGPAADVASVTVIAPTTMAADALATAAFVLGPGAGIAFLEQQGVEGLIVTPDLARHVTSGFRSEGTS